MTVTSSTTQRQKPANGTAANKRKRTRRNNRRTNAATEESSDESSSSSDSEADDVQTPRKVNSVSAKKRAEVLAQSSSDSSSSSSESSSSESSDDEEESKPSAAATHEDDKPAKRHRKRTRKGKQTTEGTTSTTTTESKAKEERITSSLSESDKSAINALRDPHEYTSSPGGVKVNEATCASLAYAKQYHANRDAWKFNKARQEHLIRHMVSIAPLQQQQSSNDNAQDDDEIAEQGPSWWPDEWNVCVAKYLATVQGGAKERLVQRLRQAAQQIEPPPVVDPTSEGTQESKDTALDTTTKTEGGEKAAKSVQFAELAMAADAQPPTDEQTTSNEERERIRFERQRARSLLTLMGESIW